MSRHHQRNAGQRAFRRSYATVEYDSFLRDHLMNVRDPAQRREECLLYTRDKKTDLTAAQLYDLSHLVLTPQAQGNRTFEVRIADGEAQILPTRTFFQRVGQRLGNLFRRGRNRVGQEVRGEDRLTKALLEVDLRNFYEIADAVYISPYDHYHRYGRDAPQINQDIALGFANIFANFFSIKAEDLKKKCEAASSKEEADAIINDALRQDISQLEALQGQDQDRILLSSASLAFIITNINNPGILECCSFKQATRTFNYAQIFLRLFSGFHIKPEFRNLPIEFATKFLQKAKETGFAECELSDLATFLGAITDDAFLHDITSSFCTKNPDMSLDDIETVKIYNRRAASLMVKQLIAQKLPDISLAEAIQMLPLVQGQDITEIIQDFFSKKPESNVKDFPDITYLVDPYYRNITTKIFLETKQKTEFHDLSFVDFVYAVNLLQDPNGRQIADIDDILTQFFNSHTEIDFTTVSAASFFRALPREEGLRNDLKTKFFAANPGLTATDFARELKEKSHLNKSEAVIAFLEDREKSGFANVSFAEFLDMLLLIDREDARVTAVAKFCKIKNPPISHAALIEDLERASSTDAASFFAIAYLREEKQRNNFADINLAEFRALLGKIIDYNKSRQKEMMLEFFAAKPDLIEGENIFQITKCVTANATYPSSSIILTDIFAANPDLKWPPLPHSTHNDDYVVRMAIDAFLSAKRNKSNTKKISFAELRDITTDIDARRLDRTMPVTTIREILEERTSIENTPNLGLPDFADMIWKISDVGSGLERDLLEKFILIKLPDISTQDFLATIHAGEELFKRQNHYHGVGIHSAMKTRRYGLAFFFLQKKQEKNLLNTITIKNLMQLIALIDSSTYHGIEGDLRKLTKDLLDVKQDAQLAEEVKECDVADIVRLTVLTRERNTEVAVKILRIFFSQNVDTINYTSLSIAVGYGNKSHIYLAFLQAQAEKGFPSLNKSDFSSLLSNIPSVELDTASKVAMILKFAKAKTEQDFSFAEFIALRDIRENINAKVLEEFFAARPEEITADNLYLLRNQTTSPHWPEICNFVVKVLAPKSKNMRQEDISVKHLFVMTLFFQHAPYGSLENVSGQGTLIAITKQRLASIPIAEFIESPLLAEHNETSQYLVSTFLATRMHELSITQFNVLNSLLNYPEKEHFTNRFLEEKVLVTTEESFPFADILTTLNTFRDTSIYQPSLRRLFDLRPQEVTVENLGLLALSSIINQPDVNEYAAKLLEDKLKDTPADEIPAAHLFTIALYNPNVNHPVLSEKMLQRLAAVPSADFVAATLTAPDCFESSALVRRFLLTRMVDISYDDFTKLCTKLEPYRDPKSLGQEWLVAFAQLKLSTIEADDFGALLEMIDNRETKSALVVNFANSRMATIPYWFFENLVRSNCDNATVIDLAREFLNLRAKTMSYEELSSLFQLATLYAPSQMASHDFVLRFLGDNFTTIQAEVFAKLIFAEKTASPEKNALIARFIQTRKREIKALDVAKLSSGISNADLRKELIDPFLAEMGKDIPHGDYLSIIRLYPEASRSKMISKFLREKSAIITDLNTLYDLAQLMHRTTSAEDVAILGRIFLTNVTAAFTDQFIGNVSYHQFAALMETLERQTRSSEASTLYKRTGDFPFTLTLCDYLRSKSNTPSTELSETELANYAIAFGDTTEHGGTKSVLKRIDTNTETAHSLSTEDQVMQFQLEQIIDFLKLPPDTTEVRIDDVINNQFRKIYAMQNYSSREAREEIIKFFQLLIFRACGDIKEISGNIDSTDTIRDNKAKLIGLFTRSKHDLARVVLQDPENLPELAQDLATPGDGCIANIGNRFENMVIKGKISDPNDKLLYLAFYHSIFGQLNNSFRASDGISHGDLIGLETNPLNNGPINRTIVNPSAFISAIRQICIPANNKMIVFSDVDLLPPECPAKKWLDSVDAKHRAKALNHLSYDAVTSVSYKDEPTGIAELDSLDFTKKESYLIGKVEELQAFRIFCRAFESCKDLPTIARISETNEALSKLLIEAITNMTEVDLQGVKNAFDAAVRKEEEELASKSKPKKDPHITSTEQFAKKDRDHVTPPSLVSVI